MTVSRPALFPSAFYPHLGGVEELTRQLALEQARGGLHPLIVTNRWPRALPGSDGLDGLSIRRVPFRVPAVRPRQLISWAARAGSAHRETQRILQDWQADAVHVQCVSSNVPFAIRASRSLDLPLVVTAQGELSMDADRTFERSALARAMARRAVRRADVVTGCSRYVVDELDRFTGGRHADKLRVIYNGVDLAECGAAVAERRDRPYVLGLGRLVPQKGFDVLVRAFARLASHHPDQELLIAGDGTARAGLERLADELGLGSRTHFLGPVSHSRALALFAGAEAFALCSRREPQGIVVLEAMAAGCPVVAATVGGVPEIVDGSNGLLFRSGDHGDLSDQLRCVLGDPLGAADLRRAGRSTAERFSWAALAAQYSAAYDDAERRSRR